MTNSTSDSQRPILLGHRGAMACAPENTMASFAEGLRQGADMLELDVHLSADGEVVVIHDEWVDRTTDGHGRVPELTLAELKKLDAGSWFAPNFAGERIPTLEEVLAWARDKTPLAIEIKHGQTPYLGIEEKVVQLVKKYDMVSRVIVISFDHKCLPRFKKLCPDLKTGILYVSRLADPVGAAAAARADSIRPLWTALDYDSVLQAHEAGLTVDPWGRDADYARLVEWGVDSLAADHPAQVRELLGW